MASERLLLSIEYLHDLYGYFPLLPIVEFPDVDSGRVAIYVREREGWYYLRGYRYLEDSMPHQDRTATDAR